MYVDKNFEISVNIN